MVAMKELIARYGGYLRGIPAAVLAEYQLGAAHAHPNIQVIGARRVGVPMPPPPPDWTEENSARARRAWKGRRNGRMSRLGSTADAAGTEEANDLDEDEADDEEQATA